MKRVTLLLTLFCWGLGVVAQTGFDNTTQFIYDSLIANKQYQTAYEWLDAKDPDNQNPEVFYKKADLVLEYFALSMMHQMFGLRNLKPGEDLMQIRRDMEGTSSMIMLDIPTIADKLLKNYADNVLLYRIKGQYYFEVYLKYGSSGGMSEKELLQNAVKAFTKAIESGDKYAPAYYVIGFSHLMKKEYDQALTQFAKTVALDNTYASAHYNAAYIYTMQENWPLAQQKALLSAQYYTDSSYKADAYRIAGLAAKELINYSEAISFFQTSLRFHPNPATYNYLIEIAFAQKDGKQVKAYSDDLIKLDPMDGESYRDLFNMYADQKAINELITFLDGYTGKYKKQPEILTYIYLHLAYCYEEIQQPSKALEYFKLTKQTALKFLPETHEFIKELDSRINQTMLGK